MKIIKWGILGTGSIAKAFADALKETEGELVAAASSTCLLYTSPSPRDRG